MRCKTKPIPGNATVLLASIHLHGRGGGGEGNSAPFTDGAEKCTTWFVLQCTLHWTVKEKTKKQRFHEGPGQKLWDDSRYAHENTNHGKNKYQRRKRAVATSNRKKKKKNSQKWSSEKEQLRVVKQRLRLIRLDDAFASCFSNHWSRMDSKKK